MRRALSAAVLCLLLCGLVACGEKEESGEADPSAGSTATGTTTTATGGGNADAGPDADGGDGKQSPEELVEVAVVAVVGGGDPVAACAELVTPAYVETAYGDEQGCRAAVAAQGSFDVNVEEIEIEGSRASAVARPSSGPNQGEKLTVRLVEEGPVWKVDFLRSNAPAGP